MYYNPDDTLMHHGVKGQRWGVRRQLRPVGRSDGEKIVRSTENGVAVGGIPGALAGAAVSAKKHGLNLREAGAEVSDYLSDNKNVIKSLGRAAVKTAAASAAISLAGPVGSIAYNNIAAALSSASPSSRDVLVNKGMNGLPDVYKRPDGGYTFKYPESGSAPDPTA